MLAPDVFASPTMAAQSRLVLSAVHVPDDGDVGPLLAQVDAEWDALGTDAARRRLLALLVVTMATMAGDMPADRVAGFERSFTEAYRPTRLLGCERT